MLYKNSHREGKFNNLKNLFFGGEISRGDYHSVQGLLVVFFIIF